MNTPEFPSGHRNTPALKLITGFFWIVLGAAVLLALMILLLPDKVFLAISNYLQIIVAVAGALVLLYFWHRDSGQEYLLYAAGALGLWGISNIVWYVNILMGLRNEVFPSLIDMGMIASLFVLSMAFQKGFPRKQIAPHILLGILILSLVIPAGVLVTTGFSAAALVTLLYFFACGVLSHYRAEPFAEGAPENPCRDAPLCAHVYDLPAPGDVPDRKPGPAGDRHVRCGRFLADCHRVNLELHTGNNRVISSSRETKNPKFFFTDRPEKILQSV